MVSRYVVLAVALLTGWVLVGPGCGVEPVAADGCRQIEEARCEAAPRCPNLKVSDVDACKRFYRDQCLHGLARPDDPGGPSIERCVQAIRVASTCSAANNACVATSAPAVPCDVIEHPELAVDCAFLIPPAQATASPTLVDGGSDAATDGM